MSGDPAIGSDGGGMLTCNRKRHRSTDSSSSLPLQSVSAESENPSGAEGNPLYSTACINDVSGRKDFHWRNILKEMLQIQNGGDILSCIMDALESNSCKNGTTRIDENGIHRMDDNLEDTFQKGSNGSNFEEQGQPQLSDITVNIKSGGLKIETNGEADMRVNTKKCQNVFLDVLLSEKFVFLCDLICSNFVPINYRNMFAFAPISLKLRSGDYEGSPALFHQHIQQIWDKFRKIGQEMVLLSNDLSQTSRESFLEKVGEGFVDLNKEKTMEIGCICTDNSTSLCTTSKLPSSKSDDTSKHDQYAPFPLPTVSLCKQCGAEVDGNINLICNGCGSACHLFCTKLPEQKSPRQSWYCSDCLPGHVPNDSQQNSLHENCDGCTRIESPEASKQFNLSGGESIANDSRMHSISAANSGEYDGPSDTALLRLCKHCRSCEHEDKRFLICGYTYCRYKYYHIRCLTSRQIASHQQQDRSCWNCPSCLCRVCLCDRDDDMVFMCDGCDEAYHFYCVKPALASIPTGEWYCIECNEKRAKEGMKRSDLSILQQLSRKNIEQSNASYGSLDLLLEAAVKLHSEERVSVGKELMHSCLK